jgi:hypothetical protein
MTEREIEKVNGSTAKVINDQGSKVAKALK